MGIHWDPSLNLGSILAVVTFILMALKMNSSQVERLARIETKVDAMWQAFSGRRRHNDDDAR